MDIKSQYKFLKNRSGVSGVIVMLLMVSLTIVLIAIIWWIVNNLLVEKTESTKSCFGLFDKVQLSDRFTCYEDDTQEVIFSIEVGDANIDVLIVSISSLEKNENFKLTNSVQEISGLAYYNGTTSVRLPGNNAGRTYNYSWNSAISPNVIKIAPVVNDRQCDVSDLISELDNCNLILQ